MAQPDYKRIKSDTNIVSLISKYVQLTQRNNEQVGLCPFHDDHKGSLQVSEKKQIFKCFACGQGGDVFDFLNAMGRTTSEAVNELMGGTATGATPTKNDVPIKEKTVWKQIMPDGLPESIHHYKHGNPSKTWSYYDSKGYVIGLVCRFDLGEGVKEVLPYTFRTDGVRKMWRWEGFDSPRPMFNLHLLTKYPTSNVIVVEGEKTAEHAQQYFDPQKTVVTTWIGGANGILKTDFTPINGRNVYFCPDNDLQGLSAMLQIKSITTPKKSKTMPLDATLPKGWDFADITWNATDLKAFIIGRSVDEIPTNHDGLWRFIQIGTSEVYEFGPTEKGWIFKHIKEQKPEKPTPPELPENGANTATTETVVLPRMAFVDYPSPPINETHDGHDTDDVPFFRFMGYEKNESGTQSFTFYVYRSNQIVRLSPSSMTKSNLLLLAPLNWWEGQFPAERAKFDIEAAANYLIEISIKAGIFNPDHTRGRGAWVDGKSVVIHTGAKLVVDGQDRPFNAFKSKYIYEASQDLNFDLGSPLSIHEGKKILDLISLLNWEKPINAYLLAGWCVIAPICGALKWRPHIWITGAAGSGKTWIFNNILKRMLGETAVSVEGSTTESGIRNYLGQDALPVLFDEAEGEDRNARERIQNVLDLMRGASTSNGNMILKGSMTGGYKKFIIKTCFAYCSIGISLSQQADRSRVTVLSVNKVDGEQGKARFEAINRAYAECMTDETISGILSRTVSILPVILKNAATFSAAAAVVLGDQRSGDQVGAMLAGAYSLISSKAVDFNTALEWVKSKDWSDDNKNVSNNDEFRLITHLMERVSTIEIKNTKSERTIGELVHIANNPPFIEADNDILREVAIKRLHTLGFKVDYQAGTIMVSNTAEFVKSSLKDTAWANNHSTILKRLKGATTKEGTTFGSFIKSRAVEIPLSTIFD